MWRLAATKWKRQALCHRCDEGEQQESGLKLAVETNNCAKVCHTYVLVLVARMLMNVYCHNQLINQWVNRNEGVAPLKGLALIFYATNQWRPVYVFRHSPGVSAGLHNTTTLLCSAGCLCWCCLQCLLHILLQIWIDSLTPLVCITNDMVAPPDVCALS